MTDSPSAAQHQDQGGLQPEASALSPPVPPSPSSGLARPIRSPFPGHEVASARRYP